MATHNQLRMDLLTLLLGGLALAVVALYLHLTKSRGHLESLDIPILKPVLGILGSAPLDIHNHHLFDVHKENFEKFGTKTYGRYDGITPVVVTMDTEIIKGVLVRHFENFVDIFPEVREAATVTTVLATCEKHSFPG